MNNNDFRPIRLDELMAIEFTGNRWVVPGILPTGLSLLAGRPKQGKSILAANLALEIASGLDMLQSPDYPCEAGTTLLFSLEDGKVRLQQRLIPMLNELGIYRMDNVGFFFEKEPLDKILTNIETWYQRHQETAKLVIIDVFTCIRPEIVKKGGTIYDIEYKLLFPLKELADKLQAPFDSMDKLVKSWEEAK